MRSAALTTRPETTALKQHPQSNPKPKTSKSLCSGQQICDRPREQAVLKNQWEIRCVCTAANAAHSHGMAGGQDHLASQYGALLFAINAFSLWYCPNNSSLYAEVRHHPSNPRMQFVYPLSMCSPMAGVRLVDCCQKCLF